MRDPPRLAGNTTKGSLERLRALRFKPRGTARFRRYELVSVCAEFGNGGAIPTSCLSMPFLVSRFCRVHPGPRVLPTFFLAAALM